MSHQYDIGIGFSKSIGRIMRLCMVAIAGTALSGFCASAPTATPQNPYQGLFRSPTRVAMDATGNLYVSDSRAGQVLKLSTNGTSLVVKNGLNKPLAVAGGNQGLVYVSEEGAGRVLVFNTALTNSLYALGAGSNEFQLANHIAVDTVQSNGWVYVSDSRANQIRCYTNAALVKSFGTKGAGAGQFDFPAGVYVSPNQELFVVDQNNDRVQVFNRTGVYQRVFSLKTSADLITTNVYGRAQGITGDNAGRLYITDAFQGEIKVFDTNGVYLSTIGGFGEWIGQFRAPGSAVLGLDNRLFVASIDNNRIEIFGIQGGGAVYVTLQVVSSYGSPTPAVGVYTNVSGTLLTNSVNGIDLRGQTQFVCTGWTLSGNEPVSGSTNIMTMTHTNNAVLTWQWKTQYSLTLTAGSHGSVSSSNVWWDAGSTANATATPAPYYHFTQWTGTVTSAVNPLSVMMNTPQSIVSLFDANLATNSTPEWWLAQYNLTNVSWDTQALADQDGDGVVTWREYCADTIPTNPASFLAFYTIQPLPSGLNLAWHGGILATQFLESASTLTNGWQTIATNLPPTATSKTITNTPAGNPLFYRIRVTR